MITLYTKKTRSCATSIQYALAYLGLKFKVVFIDSNHVLPEPTTENPFPCIPYIADSTNDKKVYGVLQCLCYIAKESHRQDLLPDDNKYPDFFLFLGVEKQL